MTLKEPPARNDAQVGLRRPDGAEGEPAQPDTEAQADSPEPEEIAPQEAPEVSRRRALSASASQARFIRRLLRARRGHLKRQRSLQ